MEVTDWGTVARRLRHDWSRRRPLPREPEVLDIAVAGVRPTSYDDGAPLPPPTLSPQDATVMGVASHFAGMSDVYGCTAVPLAMRGEAALVWVGGFQFQHPFFCAGTEADLVECALILQEHRFDHGAPWPLINGEVPAAAVVDGVANWTHLRSGNIAIGSLP